MRAIPRTLQPCSTVSLPRCVTRPLSLCPPPSPSLLASLHSCSPFPRVINHALNRTLSLFRARIHALELAENLSPPPPSRSRFVDRHRRLQIDSIPLPCAYFFTIELRDEFFGSRFVYRNIRKIRVCSFAINFYIYIASFCIILFEIYGDFEIVFRKINLGEYGRCCGSGFETACTGSGKEAPRATMMMECRERQTYAKDSCW